MNNDLQRAYRNGRLILFVGAGVSANLGLPLWKDLIDKLAGELGFDARIFSTYGEALALAEYYRRKKGNIGGLRSWMDRAWHHSDVDISKSDVHRLIAQGRFSRIYTTNYDRWLELAHDAFGVSYVKIANVSDLAKAGDLDRQIVKLHGDFDDDASLVLDETSYFERLSFEAPLDIKLRADVLGRSVLFVGYSLRDINIRLLFYKLTKAWSASASVRPASFLLAQRPNPVAEELLDNWGIQTIVSDRDEPGLALSGFLQELTA